MQITEKNYQKFDSTKPDIIWGEKTTITNIFSLESTDDINYPKCKNVNPLTTEEY